MADLLNKSIKYVSYHKYRLIDPRFKPGIYLNSGNCQAVEIICD